MRKTSYDVIFEIQSKLRSRAGVSCRQRLECFRWQSSPFPTIVVVLVLVERLVVVRSSYQRTHIMSYSALDREGSENLRSHEVDEELGSVCSTHTNRSKSSKLSFLSKKSRRRRGHNASLKEPLTGGGDNNHHYDDVRDGGDVSVQSHRSSSMTSTTNGSVVVTSPSNNNNDNNKNNTIQKDPYDVFADDLHKTLQIMDERMADYLRIVHETDTSVNVHEYKEAKRLLKRSFKNAEATLADLQTCVALVAKQQQEHSQSPHDDSHSVGSPLSEQELYARTSFVDTSRNRIARAKQDSLQSPAIKAKLLADERAKAVRRAAQTQQQEGSSGHTKDTVSDANGTHGTGNGKATPGLYGARTKAEHDNNDVIVDSQARASLLLRHQDEALDELDVAVQRVGDMAETIHDEIGQQNKMLTEMEEDLENVEEQLGLVMGKLARFLKTKDRWQLTTIMILFCTMVVLFFLVVYT